MCISKLKFDQLSCFSFQCSFYPPCKSSEIANTQTVKDYERRYGTADQSYPCLFNPNNPSQVIRTQKFLLEHVIHGTVWSSIILLSAIVILSILVKRNGIKCI